MEMHRISQVLHGRMHLRLETKVCYNFSQVVICEQVLGTTNRTRPQDIHQIV